MEKFRVYAENAQKWRTLLEKRCCSEKSLSCESCSNGIMLPIRKKKGEKFYEGGVCDEKYKFVAGLIRKDFIHPGEIEVRSSYCPEPGDTFERKNETVIFGGCLAGHFGHFISEGMGRLWYILQGGRPDARIAFASYFPGEKGWFWDFFDLLKIPRERILMVKDPTQFKEVLVPEESVHCWGHWFTKEYRIPYQCIRKNAGEGGTRRVYLTHRNWKKGPKIFHEEYFENFFRGKGFSVVSPETLPVGEQVRLVSGAEEIVTTLGTLSHFALFCKPGTHVVILTRVSDVVLPPQGLINEAAGVSVDIVDVSQNFLFADRARGAILLGPSIHWGQYVRERFHEEPKESPAWEKLCCDYMRAWVEFYAGHPKHFDKVLGESPWKALSRMYFVFFGRKLESPAFHEKSDLENMRRQLGRHEAREQEMQMQLSVFCKVLEKQKGRPLLAYRAHLSGIGWTATQYEGVPLAGQARIEAVEIRFREAFHGLYYGTYHIADGWSEESSEGEVSGTTGMKRALSGIYIRLDNDGAKDYRIYYRILCGNLGWSNWAHDGERISTNKGLMTGMEIKCISRDRIIEVERDA